MRKLTILAILSIVIAITAQSAFATGVQQPEPPVTATSTAGGEFQPINEVGRYARGFSASRRGNQLLITVNKPWQGATAANSLTYLLYPRGESAPQDVQADLTIPVPVERVITMSTTFLPHLDALGRIDSLLAVDSLDWVYSQDVRARGERGQVTAVGSGPMVDIERVLALDPDVVMVNSYGGDWDAQPVLEDADIPVVVLGDWVETDPLGPAEWLLFTAMLFDRLDEALAIFNDIESRYLELKALAEEQRDRPTVLVNAPYQGTWALSGGASYAARLIADAGGQYVWEDDTSDGSLFFDVESVYAEAGEAEVWINTGTWSSLAGAEAEDSRFTAFRAFQEGRLYNNNRRVSPAGGNDYFESGALNPHVVLKDLVWIFHPDLVPGYEPVYYQRLR